jgi:tetratricopeptide (TPR) repeat protein
MTRIGLLAFLGAFIATGPVSAQDTATGGGDQAHYEACMALAETNPAAALVSAQDWIAAEGGAPAEHCRAVALIDLGRPAEAGEALELLAEGLGTGQESLRVALLTQAGQAWFLAGELDQAERVQTAALALAPKDVDLLVDRSLTLAAGKRYWEAADDLNEANSLAPGRPDVLVYRASAYRFLEAYDLAMADLRAALAMTPNDPVALLERGNVYGRTGEDELARDDWARVVTLAPDSEAARAARANLLRLESEPEAGSATEPE